MDKQLKNILIGITFGVCLFAGLMHLDAVGAALARLAGLLRPLILAGLLAFVLNVPMTRLEGWLKKRLPAKAAGHTRGPALALSLLLVVLVVVVIAWVVIPQFVTSFAQAINQVQGAIPRIAALLRDAGMDSSVLNNLDFYKLGNDWLQKLTTGVGQAGTAVLGTVTSVAGVAGDFLMALVFMVYFLLEKEMLARQTTWLFRLVTPHGWQESILGGCRCLQKTYADFFSGQCIEACILGALMFVAFTIFRLPYAGLVAVLTAVTSFIPFIGSFLSCGVAVVLVLLINPWRALLAFVVYQVVQFCENQFIYPRVVGSAVGLPPLYTILAVFLGGKLFGVVGMVFFIPLMATGFTLLRAGETGGEP